MKGFFTSGHHCQEQEWFLPNCRQPRLLVAGLILGQLLAFVLMLSPLGKGRLDYGWSELLYFSLIIQLIIVTSMGGMCVLRDRLCRFKTTTAALVAFAIIQLATVFWTEVTWLVISFRHMFALPVDAAWDETFYFPALGLRARGAGEVEALTNHMHLLLLFRNLGISAIVGGVALHYFYIMHQWKLKRTAELQARMQALQSRMRPHFLFNTMNTIASLTRFDAERAEQAVQDFSGLMRAALGDARHLIPLAEEVALCQQYLRIESLRMGERLEIEWRMEMLPQDALMPSLSLQPLLENAVSYGIHPRPEGGMIRVSGLSDGEFIKIDVENPMPENPPKRTGNKIAQANLRQRLEIYFGHHGRLETQVVDGNYTASLRFPYQKGSDHEHFDRG